MKIWEPKAPGTLWATPGLLRDSFTFTFYMEYEIKEFNTLWTDEDVECSGEDDDVNDRDEGVGLGNKSSSW